MWILLLCSVALPMVLILAWERFVIATSPPARLFYRTTGLVGAPVHELAHVIACLLFRMPISKVVLYQPGAAGGRLGYVAFSYNPRSGLHAAGRMIQGVAPLLAGACIARYALQVDVVTPGGDATSLTILSTLANSASSTLDGLITLATSGAWGGLQAVLLLAVCIHAIPSRSDVQIGIGGLLWLSVFLAALGVLLALLGADVAGLAVVRNTLVAVNFALWQLSIGIVTVATVSIIGTGGLIVLPNAVWALLRRERAGSIVEVEPGRKDVA
jgi:hypothetical protein